ncbi:MAG: hypothetical protein BWK73_05460 [Thiothrix lacustris]|jgi:putative transcriptional regulator|uniref:Uncharacterized protein n=1 Tax=Thiothrix lacustris TaxID=525917 RepID=A0A1Y1QWZ2_9GAMM|nr:MAG: hypothetical protein BWK73_05460 [Thiothrix lacustris]
MIISSIKQGLEEAITFAKGNCPQAKVHQFSLVRVKNVRAKVGMTQVEYFFSSEFILVLKILIK